jgi:hypothetical protein
VTPIENISLDSLIASFKKRSGDKKLGVPAFESEENI